MYTPIITTYGETLAASGDVNIEYVALIAEYIKDIKNKEYVTETVLLLQRAAGNVARNIWNVCLEDNSGTAYTAKSILFYVVGENSLKKLIAGYSQDTPIVIKDEHNLNLFLSFNFSAFKTNGFTFPIIKAGYPAATADVDGLLHIENESTTADDSYSVYSKVQVDTRLSNITATIPTKTSQLTNDSGFLTDAVLNTYLKSSDAAATYLSKTDASSTYLSIDTATSTYLSKTDASSTYAKKESIPTKTSQLTNDSGYLTEHQSLDGYATKTYVDTQDSAIEAKIPTKVSQLTNDSGYLTSYTETDPTVPSWAKQDTKPSYTLDEVSDGTTRKLSNYVPTSRKVNGTALTSDITLSLDNVADGITRKIPTKTSQLTNDSGYLTSYTETDPTVPAWAKATSKPTYTLDEVVDGSTRKLSNYVPTSRTVNSKALSSNITLTLDDVGDGTTRKIPTVNNGTITIQKNSSTVGSFTTNQSAAKTINIPVPTKTSELTNDSNYITSTDLETELDNYVTLDTDQTIGGLKTFDSTITNYGDIFFKDDSSSTGMTILSHFTDTGNERDNGEEFSLTFHLNNNYPSYVCGINTFSNIYDDITSTATNTPLYIKTTPTKDNIWSIGTSDYQLAGVYAHYFYGNVSGNLYGNADTATTATSLADKPSLSFTNASSSAAGSTLTVTAGGKTSSAVTLTTVRQAYQPYVDASSTDAYYPITFTTPVNARSSIASGFKPLYTDNVNSFYYNPSSNTLVCPNIGTTSTYSNIYAKPLHARGTGAGSGVIFCDGNYETSAYSSITGYQSDTNGQMVFHHYNATNGIDYTVTNTGPNTTDTSTAAATLTTIPQSTGTWTVGSSTRKLAAVYANNFYGTISSATSSTYSTYAQQLNVLTSSSATNYPIVFTTSVASGYKALYTDTSNDCSYNPSTNSLSCTNFIGLASKATADGNGNTITSTYLKSISLDTNNSTTEYSITSTGASTTSSTLTMPSHLLKLVLGSGNYSYLNLRSVVASIIAGCAQSGSGVSSSYVGTVRLMMFQCTAVLTSNRAEGYYISGTQLYQCLFYNDSIDLGAEVKFRDTNSYNTTPTLSSNHGTGTWRILHGFYSCLKNHCLMCLAVRVL